MFSRFFFIFAIALPFWGSSKVAAKVPDIGAVEILQACQSHIEDRGYQRARDPQSSASSLNLLAQLLENVRTQFPLGTAAAIRFHSSQFFSALAWFPKALSFGSTSVVPLNLRAEPLAVRWNALRDFFGDKSWSKNDPNAFVLAFEGEQAASDFLLRLGVIPQYRDEDFRRETCKSDFDALTFRRFLSFLQLTVVSIVGYFEINSVFGPVYNAAENVMVPVLLLPVMTFLSYLKYQVESKRTSDLVLLRLSEILERFAKGGLHENPKKHDEIIYHGMSFKEKSHRRRNLDLLYLPPVDENPGTLVVYSWSQTLWDGADEDRDDGNSHSFRVEVPDDSGPGARKPRPEPVLSY